MCVSSKMIDYGWKWQRHGYTLLFARFPTAVVTAGRVAMGKETDLKPIQLFS